jgi:2,4-dienoyl-CoA reductase-like NADH-dependent reductase (Old Yellow Enzyme family)/thioredoxin reductase
MSLKLVFEPIRIRHLEVPNRVVRTAHSTAFTFGDNSDDSIAYHAARAKGGCGLSILEAAGVHPSSRIAQSVARDSCIPGFQALMAAVNPYGMRIFQQLWHGGNLALGEGGEPPLAVSDIVGYTGIVGRPMNQDDIEEVKTAFADAAARCQKGGLHGVELHAAHGYLFQQFLSPIFNNRTDAYGGSLENRMRFLKETFQAVRKAVGPSFVVGVRMSVSEAPREIQIPELQTVIRTLEAEGLIDYLSVSMGDYYRSDPMVGCMHNPTGYELPLSGQLTAVAHVPRIVAGRFRTLEEAEQVLREGQADLVSMVRAQIADPELVNKTRAGHAEQVRPCISCNQGCVGGELRGGRMGCLVNPAVGFERHLAEDLIVKTTTSKKVLVVGGGPGGMEAARVAALMGHKVVLVEASADLGGTVNIAKRAPKLSALGDITYWLEQEVYRLGVEVRLGTYFEAEDIRQENADAVIIATGSIARKDGLQNRYPGEPAHGADLGHVFSAAEVLSSQHANFGKHALVLDTVGHMEALAVTEYLLTEGVGVTFVTGTPSMSPYVQSTFRDGPALERFYKLGDFQVLTRHLLVEIQAKQCLVRPLQASHNDTRTIQADTVVLVTQNAPLRELYDELRAEKNIYLVGDARSPRDVQWAITEAHRVARALA